MQRYPVYESEGQEFESLRARHFSTELRTANAAVLIALLRFVAISLGRVKMLR